MWKKTCISLIMLFCVVPGVCLEAQESFRDLTFPELTLTLPEIEQQTLANGLRLFLVENHELPIIKLYALVNVGSIYEPVEKLGLTDILADVMRTGGTASRSSDEVNEMLEFLASDIEVAIQPEYGTVEAWTLRKNFNTTLELFADILMNPAFEADKVALTTTQQLDRIRRRNDDPHEIIGREFLRLVRGPRHPLARIPQPATIQAMTRADLVAFHAAYFRPDRVMLAVTGDFESTALLADLRNAFGAWAPPAEDAANPALTEHVEPVSPPASGMSVFLVPKDVEQATLMFGHPGITLQNADSAAITLLDLMLGGGGFSSRFYQRVRNDLGLAYFVGSHLGAGMREPGVFYYYCGTSSAQVGEAMQAMLAEIRDVRQHGVSAGELQSARNHYLNSFVFKFETDDAVVRRLMYYDYFGYPPDFLETFRQRVMAVTPADIQRAANAYLYPDDVTVLAVGDPDEVRPGLSIFGDVTILDLDPVE